MQPVDDISPSTFEQWPVWRYDADAENYHAVRTLDEVPTDLYDFRILGQCETPDGVRFRCCVIGINDFFAIGLFAPGEIVALNRNMKTDCREQVSRFLKLSDLEGQLNFDSMFPLRFKTTWSSTGVFNDFEGIFEKPD